MDEQLYTEAKERSESILLQILSSSGFDYPGIEDDIAAFAKEIIDAASHQRASK